MNSGIVVVLCCATGGIAEIMGGNGVRAGDTIEGETVVGALVWWSGKLRIPLHVSSLQSRDGATAIAELACIRRS